MKTCFVKKISLILLALLLVVGCLGCQKPEEKLTLNGQEYPLTTQMLDLSGKPLPAMAELEVLKELPELTGLDLRGTEMTLEQYETIRQILPGCEIQWEIPLEGAWYAPETKEITMEVLEMEDLAALQYFTGLETIEIAKTPDAALLAILQELVGDCSIAYTVDLGGEPLSPDVTELTLKNADTAELAEKLPLLPALTKVSLEGQIPAKEDLLSVVQANPRIHFLFEMELFGQTVSTDAVELDFSGTIMESVDAVEEILPFFPVLEKVVMCDCGIPSEEMDALWKRNPDVRFVWAVQVGMMHLRTDITYLMPYQYGYTAGKYLHYTQCEEMKYLVDVVCMDLGHMQVREIPFINTMTNLEYLILGDCGLTDISNLAGLPKLKYLELFANHITDVSALATLPALEDLNLCYNKVADVTPLLEIETLNNLWISAAHLTGDQVKILEEQMPEDVNLVMNQSSISGGWRQLPNYYAQRDILGMPYF